MSYIGGSIELKLLFKLQMILVILFLVSCNGTDQKEKVQIGQRLSENNEVEVSGDLTPNNTDSSIETAKSILDDISNHRNTVYIKELSYKYDGDFNKYAKITIENTTKHLVIGISFRLDGYVNNGCTKSYEIKRKIKLKPNKSINISQLIAEGDCEAHVIEYIQYVLSDGTINIGT